MLYFVFLALLGSAPVVFAASEDGIDFYSGDNQIAFMARMVSSQSYNGVAASTELNATTSLLQSALHALLPVGPGLLGSTVSLLQLSYLKFQDVVTNIGNGYDWRTGIFTAPECGLYVFHVTVKTSTGDSMIDMEFTDANGYIISLYANSRTRTGSKDMTTADDVERLRTSAFVFMEKGKGLMVRQRGTSTMHSDLYGAQEEAYGTIVGYRYSGYPERCAHQAH